MSDPVTLITGTSTGIGLATALHLARRGHRVYASMRDLGRGEELHKRVAAEKLPVTLVQLDVDSPPSVERTVAEVLQREGRVDVLVNNAGIAPFNPIELATDVEAKQVFETNFFGALRMIRAVLPAMRERRSGCIVNISSVAGRIASSCMGIYSASKFALEAASEALAREVASHGIRVVLIEPGIIITPILEKALNNLPLDQDSPYRQVAQRVQIMFAEGQKKNAQPQVVAEVIESALIAKDPKLRFPAGPDAEPFLKGRTGMTDEEWIAMERHATDDAYFAEFAARFPGLS